MKGGGRPRYHELVEPFLGEHVVLVGRVVNGQIDVEISDLTLAP
jgi:hypothetical protein